MSCWRTRACARRWAGADRAPARPRRDRGRRPERRRGRARGQRRDARPRRRAGADRRRDRPARGLLAGGRRRPADVRRARFSIATSREVVAQTRRRRRARASAERAEDASDGRPAPAVARSPARADERARERGREPVTLPGRVPAAARRGRADRRSCSTRNPTRALADRRGRAARTVSCAASLHPLHRRRRELVLVVADPTRVFLWKRGPELVPAPGRPAARRCNRSSWRPSPSTPSRRSRTASTPRSCEVCWKRRSETCRSSTCCTPTTAPCGSSRRRRSPP